MDRISLEAFNALGEDEARARLLECCDCQQWAQIMLNNRPFLRLNAVRKHARTGWWALDPSVHVATFETHPRIGADAIRAKFKGAQFSAQEQAQVAGASEDVLDALVRGNDEYFAKFGFTFIVFATGKSADDILKILEASLKRDRAAEVTRAAEELLKITELRLFNKLLLAE